MVGKGQGGFGLGYIFLSKVAYVSPIIKHHFKVYGASASCVWAEVRHWEVCTYLRCMRVVARGVVPSPCTAYLYDNP